MEERSPLHMLYHWETNTPEKVYLRQPIGGTWKTWTWKETANEVRRMAAALKKMDFPPGSHIALLSKNCAHWILCDLAIMMSGHVSVPLYSNLTAASMGQILQHSDAVLLFVGKLDNWPSLKPAIPEHLPCISFSLYNSDYTSWDELIQQNEPLQSPAHRSADEIVTIIYTSGTTGKPKGVMHRFRSFSFSTVKSLPLLGMNQRSKFFSYLPLSHSAERSLVEMCSLYAGGEVFFCESIEEFSFNLVAARPTVFLAVHHIWKKIQQRILKKMPQKRLDRLLKVPILSGLIKKRIRRSLGLDSATTIFTGAAPTPVELIRWFGRIGIHIQEAYGLTENWSYSHANRRQNIRVGSVGLPLPGVAVKIGEYDEVQVKHDALMAGYYKDDSLTREAFTDDGFLKTGDEGFVDEEGFLKITGRIKDLFKTAKGKYVAPSPIEMKFAANCDLEQVCVVGAGLPQPMALVILTEKGKKSKIEETNAGLNDTLSDINSTLDAHEKVHKIVVLNDEWTVENNLLTPSFKIKRHEIEKKYTSFYEEWNNAEGGVARQT